MNRQLALAYQAGGILAVAWGVFAFGAVYTWAFTPLAVLCAATGLLALVTLRDRRPPLGTVAATMALVGVAIGLQIIPLPRSVFTMLSPGADAFFRQLDFGYALATPGTAAWQPLSINPPQTVVGLMLFVSFALFALGMSRVVSLRGARGVTIVLIALGVIVALVGIAQVAVYPAPTPNDPTLIYGFWRPQYFSFPFGPFINRNHFAGWMLMALPLALSYFWDALQRAIDDAPHLRGDWLAFTGSPQFGTIVASGAAVALMGVSLAMTRSRSGLIAFAVGCTVAALVVIRRQRSTKARLVVVAAFVALLVGTASWAGLETITSKFTDDTQATNSVGGRTIIWHDTARIAHDFMLTGSGLNTYGTAMVKYQSRTIDVHYNEAHNDYLQIAAEGGLLVGIPVVACVLVFTAQVHRRFREAPKVGTTYWIRVGAVIGLVSVAIQSLFEFSLQMPGNAVLFALLVGIALHQSPNLRPARR